MFFPGHICSQIQHGKIKPKHCEVVPPHQSLLLPSRHRQNSVNISKCQNFKMTVIRLNIDKMFHFSKHVTPPSGVSVLPATKTGLAKRMTLLSVCRN